MKVKRRKSGLKRTRMCGFRRRMKTRGGRTVIRRRRRKGKAVANIKRRK